MVAALLVLLGRSAAQPAWSKVTPSTGAAPKARSLALLSYFEAQDSLVLFGGDDEDGTSLGDTWLFDISSSTWSEVATTGDAPAARFSLNGGVNEAAGELIVFGGEGEDRAVFNDAFSLNLTTGVWTRIGTGGGAPEPRYGSAGGVVLLGPDDDAFLLVTHGFDKKTRWDNSFALRLADGAWLDVSPPAGAPLPTARCLVAGAAMRSSQPGGPAVVGMYGGCGSGGYGPCPSSEMWALTVTGLADGGAGAVESSWRRAPTCLHARNYGAMAADPSYEDGTFFTYGGDGGVLVGKDEPGQLNSISEGGADFAWSQTVLGGAAGAASVPGQPKGRRQSSMVAVPASGTAFLLLGESSDLFAVDYGSAPSLGALSQQGCNSDPIPGWRAAHGALMGLAWGVLIPLGVLVARFGRLSDPLWFRVHRALNSAGVLLGTLGFVISMLMVSAGRFLAAGHSFIGVAVTLLGLAQPIGAMCRPHAPDKGALASKARRRWELSHKWGGRLAVVLGLVNPFIGLTYLTSTTSAGYIVYSLWVAFLVGAFAYLSARGLPYTANGPSVLAQKANSVLCLEPWDDAFKPRRVVDGKDESSPALT